MVENLRKGCTQAGTKVQSTLGSTPLQDRIHCCCEVARSVCACQFTAEIIGRQAATDAYLGSMQVGQRVVCVNDAFEPWIHEYYDQLPVKDETYTIRAVSLGRGTLVGSDSAEVRLLLQELHNEADPHHVGLE